MYNTKSFTPIYWEHFTKDLRKEHSAIIPKGKETKRKRTILLDTFYLRLESKRHLLHFNSFEMYLLNNFFCSVRCCCVFATSTFVTKNIRVAIWMFQHFMEKVYPMERMLLSMVCHGISRMWNGNIWNFMNGLTA